MLTGTRREFLAALAGAAVCAARPAGRRNVLFIAIDDLNDWVGCLSGHPDVKTPNLDRLAARGLLFTNAHCAAPLCNSSRAALLTGLRPSSSGVYDNRQPFRKASPSKNAVTLPQHLIAQGYRVVGAG
ncbi:MAG: sulfatase-like hydrolase/transferase [Bryobacteraceae bacterium]